MIGGLDRLFASLAAVGPKDQKQQGMSPELFLGGEKEGQGVSIERW